MEEERISEFEDRSIRTIQSEEQRGKEIEEIRTEPQRTVRQH